VSTRFFPYGAELHCSPVVLIRGGKKGFSPPFSPIEPADFGRIRGILF